MCGMQYSQFNMLNVITKLPIMVLIDQNKLQLKYNCAYIIGSNAL